MRSATRDRVQLRRVVFETRDRRQQGGRFGPEIVERSTQKLAEDHRIDQCRPILARDRPRDGSLVGMKPVRVFREVDLVVPIGAERGCRIHLHRIQLMVAE